MTEKQKDDTGTDHPEGRQTDNTRKMHGIRFSDSEWQLVEKAAAERGISASGLVRQAAVGLATGQLSDTTPEKSPAFTSVAEALIERMYNGVYLLATLKREEMLDKGLKEELDKIVEDGRRSKKLIHKSIP